MGDYTRVLAGALEELGLQTGIFGDSFTDGFTYFEMAGCVSASRPDIVHLQYPAAGFGRSLTPQFFSLLHPVVLTTHEFQGAHVLRRLAFYPLWLRSPHVIFTTEANRDYAVKWAPWLSRKSSVIPLSANIPVATESSQRVDNEVIHFGLVRPNKGMEEVLEFARLAAAENLPVRVRIVGSPQAGDGRYLRSIQEKARGLAIVWELNLPAEAVASRLARATLAYQPFPDGASEKRASLLAALANGVPVITTKGRFTPSALDNAVCFSSNATEALHIAKNLLETRRHREELSMMGTRYAQRFSWRTIAESHLAIYRGLVERHADRD